MGRVLLWILGTLAALVLIVFVGSFFIDEPIREMTEKQVNSHLTGYTVRIPKLHLQLIGLRLTVKGLTIFQQEHPKPPIAAFPVIKATIHWWDLLHLRLVGDMTLGRPDVHINLLQLRTEAEKKAPVKERGRQWQQAVEDLYPLKINRFTIQDGSVSYIDQDPKRPLTLSHLNFEADNVRNVWSPDKVYPSSFHIDTTILKTGHAAVNGRANFLAEPYAAVKASVKLESIPLDDFTPVAERYNVSIKGGTLSATGDMEYAPRFKKAHLDDVTIQGMKVDYTHTAKTAKAESKRATEAKSAAKQAKNEPGVLYQVDHLNLTGCTFGFTNTVGKNYRVFLSDADLRISNLSNHFSQGAAKATLTGQFMGSGDTNLSATFRPEQQGADFDLYLKIKNTQLTSLNDLLRAYGNFDVEAGQFSLVTEMHVNGRKVDGYVKPFFKNMKVYDRRTDEERGIFHQMYEMLVGGIAKLLENEPHHAVATKADISGRISNPKTSTWEILVDLFKNAFIKAILPRFEKEVTAQNG